MLDILELEAEKTAREVIEGLQLTELPICPFKIAESNDILVGSRPSQQGGVSGFLMLHENSFGIYHASHIKNEGFIRFTVAHELGHYFLDGHAQHLFPGGSGLHRSRSGFVSSDRYERQADQFATALLMPPRLFRDSLRRSGSGFKAIERLATTFVTSLTSTAIRFAKFADDPVAIIVSSGTKVEYCFISKAINDLPKLRWLKKGDFVSPSTITYEFNRDPDNVRSARRSEGCSSLDLWFEDAPNIEMNEDVIGLGSYGKTLTVLHTTEAFEDEEGDSEEDNGFDRVSGDRRWR